MANEMQIAIKISPDNLLYSEMNWKSMISHNVPGPSFTATYSHDDGMLLLDFLYNSTLEGHKY